MKWLLLSGFFLSGIVFSTGQTPLDTAVNFSVVDIDGETHELFEYLDAGKHVLIDFFYTTCNPCIGSIPVLNAAFEKYGCNQGEVIFLSIDYGDTNLEVEEYHHTYGNLAPAVSGLEGGGNQVLFDYGIVAFPTIILIGPDRGIVNQDIFPVTSPNLDFAIGQQAGIGAFPEGCFFTSTAGPAAGAERFDLALFPNPVGDWLSVAFHLPRPASVAWVIYDRTGRACQFHSSADLNAGAHRWEDPLSLPAGQYWLCLLVDHRVAAVQAFLRP